MANANETKSHVKYIQTTKFLISNTRIEVNAVNANGLTALDIVAQSRRDIKDFEISECLRNVGGLRTTNVVNSPSHATRVTSNKGTPSAARDHKILVPTTQQHNFMIENPEDWLTRKRDSLMVVASLIATMAFQAGLNPPGGLWQDDNGTGRVAGKSIMADKQPDNYAYYPFTNTIGFVTSLSIILLLVTGLPFKRRFLMWVLTVIVWVTITCMVTGNVTGNQTSFFQNLISA